MEVKTIAVNRLLDFSEEDVAAINRLLQQLSSSALMHDAKTLRKILKQDHHYVFAARDQSRNNQIVGMAAIFFEDRLEGWLSEIHSVTVDRAYRGFHIGDQITSQLVAAARIKAQEEERNIVAYLTCKPDRAEANKMYKKYGFELVAKAIPMRDPKNRKVLRDPITGKTKYKGTNLYRRLFQP